MEERKHPVTPVKVKARVVTDNSGVPVEIPLLITEQGVLEPLLDYLLHYHHDRSYQWMERTVHSVYLFMQYMEANENCFSSPEVLFRSFVQKLYSGTVSEQGFDNSGLYWLPSSTQTVNGLIISLTSLTDYLADSVGIKPLNPLQASSSFEQRLQYAAWFRKNQNDFLGHIKHKGINDTVEQARSIRGRRTIVEVYDDAIAFPESLFSSFFIKGMGGAEDPRGAIRNQLILLMMHCAGCRPSDCLHLWVEDVHIDPSNTESIVIHLYHPEEGRAPNNWRGSKGATHRAAYLKERYALAPRNRLLGTQRAGWKYRVVDHKDHYLRLFWFPQDAGVLFARLWHSYCRYLTATDRFHPYAFISFSKSALGKPLTRNALNDIYKKALKRIGKTPSKTEGLSPHGHRHAFGRRLEKSGLHPRLIQKVLHHQSISSQEVYTAPGIEQVTNALNQAYKSLEQTATSASSNKADSALYEWGNLSSYMPSDVPLKHYCSDFRGI